MNGTSISAVSRRIRASADDHKHTDIRATDIVDIGHYTGEEEGKEEVRSQKNDVVPR